MQNIDILYLWPIQKIKSNCFTYFMYFSKFWFNFVVRNAEEKNKKISLMDYFFCLRSLYEINLINIKNKSLMVKFNLARVVKRKNESTCANKEDFNINIGFHCLEKGKKVILQTAIIGFRIFRCNFFIHWIC